MSTFPIAQRTTSTVLGARPVAITPERLTRSSLLKIWNKPKTLWMFCKKPIKLWTPNCWTLWKCQDRSVLGEVISYTSFQIFHSICHSVLGGMNPKICDKIFIGWILYIYFFYNTDCFTKHNTQKNHKWKHKLARLWRSLLIHFFFF